MTSSGSSGERTSSSRSIPARVASATSEAACSASSAASGPASRRRRTSHGRVGPWMSSVPATTVKAARRSTSRCGVSSGSRKTAASVTTPRMPAHETTMPDDHGHARRRILGGPTW